MAIQAFLFGDSIAEGRATNAQSYSGGAFTARVFREDDAFHSGNDPVDVGTSIGSHWPLLFTHWLAARSSDLDTVLIGAGGTDIAGTHNEWISNWAAIITQVGQSGLTSLAVAACQIGPNAIVNATTLSQATYEAAIDTVVSQVHALSGSPKLLTPLCGQVTTGSPPDRRAAQDNIKQAIRARWNANVNCLPGPNFIDMASDDGVHPKTNAKMQLMADRWWLAIDNAIYSGTNGRGPQPTGATIDGTKKLIDITYDQTLGNTLGAALTTSAWIVKDNGTPVSVTSVAVQTSTTVRITLPSAIVGTATWTFGSGDDAVSATGPTSTAKTLPDARTITLFAEPVIDQAAAPLAPTGHFATCFAGAVR